MDTARGSTSPESDANHLADVQAWRAEIFQLKRELHALSPVRSIPLELLGEIFSSVFPQGHSKGIQERQAVLNMCLVSKRWRHAALLNHSLWSNIRLGIDQLGAFDKTVAWLNRAGGYPRTLKVIDDWGDGDLPCLGETRCPLRSPTFLKLLTDGPALDCLCFYGINVECLRHLLDHFNAFEDPALTPWYPVRSLELVFRTTEWPADYDGIPSQSIFFPLPPAASLNISLPWFTDCIVPWQREAVLSLDIPPSRLAFLTSLSFEVNWGLKFILPVLRHCQNLEDLELDFDNPTSSYLSSTQDLPIYERFLASGIRLPKLRKLRLSRQHPYLDVLDFLTAPALRNLNLHFEIGEICYKGDEEQQALEEAAASLEKPLFPFLQRSGCIANLRSLSIYGRTLSSDELIAVFSKLPAITHLSLACVNTDYEMLWDGAAQSLDASTGVCSLARLESLELKGLETISTDELQAIGGFFKAAGRRQGRLHVTLSPSSKGGLELALGGAGVERLRSMGVAVDVMPWKRRWGNEDSEAGP